MTTLVDMAREVALLRAEWHLLTPLQRVHRLALIEFTTPEEWSATASIFERRGLILEAQRWAA